MMCCSTSMYIHAATISRHMVKPWYIHLCHEIAHDSAVQLC